MSGITTEVLRQDDERASATHKRIGLVPKKRKISKAPRTSHMAPILGAAIDAIVGKEHKLAIADLFAVAADAGIEILPISRGKIDGARSHLECRGMKSAKKRSEAWRRACDAVPVHHRHGLGIRGQVFGLRSVARLECKPSKVPALQAEIDEWKKIATRPITGICDMHDPLTDYTARRYGEHVVDYAFYLVERNYEPTKTLEDVLSPRAMEFYLKDVAKEDKKNETKTNVRSKLGPCGRLARDLWGPSSASARFIAAQAKARSKGIKPLSDDDIRRLLNLAEPTEFRRLIDLPLSLMAEAWDENVCSATRLMLANFACMLRIQAELLLRPQDLSALRLDGNGAVVRTRVKKASGRVSVTQATLALLKQRAELRLSLGAPGTEYLFPSNKKGHQASGRVGAALAKLMDDRGVPGMTIPILRDLGAVILLLDDQQDLRRVADILDVNTIGYVRRRYKAFRWGDGT